MGVNSSKQITESTTKIVNDVLNETLNTIENTAEARATNFQTMEIVLDGSTVGCPITIVQDGVVKARAMVNASNSLATLMETNLKNTLDKEVENKLEQINKGLSFGQINVSTQKTSIMTNIENKIKNIVKNSVENIVKASGNSDQKLVFLARNAVINCPEGGGGINITQKALVEVVAETIATNIVETVMATDTANTIKEIVSNDDKKKNSGLDLTGWILWVIVGIIVFILIIIGVIIYLSSGKSEDTNTMPIGYENAPLEPQPLVQPPSYQPPSYQPPPYQPPPYQPPPVPYQPPPAPYQYTPPTSDTYTPQFQSIYPQLPQPPQFSSTSQPPSYTPQISETSYTASTPYYQ
jgi:hypothetical protein